MRQKPILADGVEGCLIRTMGGLTVFRVYAEDHSFVDYDLHHCDLSIVIKDKDAFFYREDGIDRLDHSPATLGLKD